MELSDFFKGYIDSERTPVVICNMDFKIVYINPCAAEYYEKFGGYEMLGKSLYLYLGEEAKTKINAVIEWFKESTENNRIFAFHREEENEDVFIVALRDKNKNLIGFSSSHECLNAYEGKKYDVS